MENELRKIIDKIEDFEDKFTINTKDFYKGIEIIYDNKEFENWRETLSKKLAEYPSKNSIVNDYIKSVKEILDKEWNGIYDKKYFEELKRRIANLVDVI